MSKCQGGRNVKCDVKCIHCKKCGDKISTRVGNDFGEMIRYK